METKKCTDCGIEKQLDDFGACKKIRSGKKSQCLECIRKRVKIWNDNNREKIRMQHRTNRKFHAKPSAEKTKELAKKRQEMLTDAYVANILKVPVKNIPPELIQLKREQLRIYRLTKQLKNEIENV